MKDGKDGGEDGEENVFHRRNALPHTVSVRAPRSRRLPSPRSTAAQSVKSDLHVLPRLGVVLVVPQGEQGLRLLRRHAWRQGAGRTCTSARAGRYLPRTARRNVIIEFDLAIVLGGGWRARSTAGIAGADGASPAAGAASAAAAEASAGRRSRDPRDAILRHPPPGVHGDRQAAAAREAGTRKTPAQLAQLAGWRPAVGLRRSEVVLLVCAAVSGSPFAALHHFPERSQEPELSRGLEIETPPWLRRRHVGKGGPCLR